MTSLETRIAHLETKQTQTDQKVDSVSLSVRDHERRLREIEDADDRPRRPPKHK